MILLLITMTSCVCAGTSIVKVTQTHYQAEEDDNITLEWTFTTRSDKSPKLLFIICKLITDHRVFVVYHLHHGVEDPEFQDEQFSGRVQWDRDVLREEGRLRLHVSRLRTEDSGRYKCVVRTESDLSADHCWLIVTTSVAQEQHTTPTENPEPQDQERFYISTVVSVIMFIGIIIIITLRMAATAAVGREVANVVIRVLVVIAVLVYSITVATATAPEAAVLGLLLGGFTLLAVFASWLIPCICTYWVREPV